MEGWCCTPHVYGGGTARLCAVATSLAQLGLVDCDSQDIAVDRGIAGPSNQARVGLLGGGVVQHCWPTYQRVYAVGMGPFPCGELCPGTITDRRLSQAVADVCAGHWTGSLYCFGLPGRGGRPRSVPTRTFAQCSLNMGLQSP